MAESSITKKALGSSLKTLMMAHPFAKISVGDICAHCGMHRKSFYYHFRDKYDLLNWVFYSEFMQLFDATAEGDVWRYLRAICVYFQTNRAFYLNAFAIEGQNAFSDTFDETLVAMLGAYLQQEIGDPALRGFFCSFYSDALRCAIVRWLKAEHPVGCDEFVRLCRRTLEYAREKR